MFTDSFDVGFGFAVGDADFDAGAVRSIGALVVLVLLAFDFGPGRAGMSGIVPRDAMAAGAELTNCPSRSSRTNVGNVATNRSRFTVPPATMSVGN